MGEQRLVGGDQVLAVGEGRFAERARGAFRAADQLDDDIDGGVGGQRQRIVPPVEPGEGDAALLGPVARGDRDRLDAPARPLFQQRRIVAEQREHAATHRAQPGDADAQRIRHWCVCRPAWSAVGHDGVEVSVGRGRRPSGAVG